MKNADLIITADTILTCRSYSGYKAGVKQMNDVGLLKDGFIAVKDGKIIDVDKISKLNGQYKKVKKTINCKDKVVMPGFVDSHTHPVFAGSRVNEFQQRLYGATYEEIHAKGGGIQSTVNATRQAYFIDLFKSAKFYIQTMIKHGTTAIEAKSGYGLSVEDEIKSLKVIKKLKEQFSVDIVSTFLGAHSVPLEYKKNRAEYVNLIINKMLPWIKKDKLADNVDVFCEEGAFTLEESKKILCKAKKLGFKLKIHSDEFKNLGGTALIAKLKGLSADHLININDKDINLLAKSKSAAVLLPGTTFFLNKGKYAPARKLLEKNVITAIATDFNAGSCQSLSMQMIISLACLKMKMTPEEAINASTINGAHALGLNGKAGSIEKGKQADLCILSISDYRQLPYYFGTNLVDLVIKKGNIIAGTIN